MKAVCLKTAPWTAVSAAGSIAALAGPSRSPSDAGDAFCAYKRPPIASSPPPPAAAGDSGSEAGAEAAAALGMDTQPPEFYDPQADDKDEKWVVKMRR